MYLGMGGFLARHNAWIKEIALREIGQNFSSPQSMQTDYWGPSIVSRNHAISLLLLILGSYLRSM